MGKRTRTSEHDVLKACVHGAFLYPMAISQHTPMSGPISAEQNVTNRLEIMFRRVSAPEKAHFF
jgi:hypothetical protein